MNILFFKTTLRFVKRNKVFTGLNIVGLSLALMVSFLILLYVINELSFDGFIKDEVCRVTIFDKESETKQVGSPYLLASVLKQDFPQIESIARTRKVTSLKIKSNEEWVVVNKPIGSEPDVFPMFGIDLTGAQNECLSDMNNIVLSEQLAKKLFSDNNPVGKSLTCLINNEEHVLTVSATFDNLPVNSTFQPDCFINIQWTIDFINKAYEPYGITNVETSWDFDFWTTWIKPNKQVDVVLLNEQLKATVFEGNNKLVFGIQRLKDAYLGSNDLYVSGQKGDLKTIRIFFSISLLVLLAASFNYIILSTAISSTRAKEIGVRKTAGANISNITCQILGESVLLAFLSFPLALLLALLLKPYAESLFQTELFIIDNNVVSYLFVYLGITLIIGLVSGAYLSLYLSRLKVIEVLKNNRTGKQKVTFRYALIAIQLIIFSVLVSSALIIRAQYNYALNKDQGYQKEDIIVVNLGRFFKNYQPFINSIKSNPNVIAAGGSLFPLPMDSKMSSVYNHFKDQTKTVEIDGMAVDYGFIETMGLEIIQGRSFSQAFGNDLKNSTILNEKAVEMLGIDNPIGQNLSDKTIVGVVKDFSLYSVYEDVPPIVIYIVDDTIWQLAIRYRPNSLNALLPFIKAEWEKYAGDQMFSYSTIDEITEQIYEDEKNFNAVITLFSIVVLVISSLGIFGLMLFVGKQQIKSIGIRKVLGSSRIEIIRAFITKNLVLVLIATIASIPITIFIMNKWLSDFYYRIDIPWWVFVASFFMLIIIVVVTIFYHAYKASSMNPVNALRYE